MKESTRNVVRMHGWRVDRTAHYWMYFVYYSTYVRVFLAAGRAVKAVLGRISLGGRLFKVVFDRYHGKVVTLEDAAKLLTLNEDIVLGPERTERVIPYQYANRVILKEPEYIAVMDCPCRLAKADGCRPVNVCMAVGRTTAQFWMEHGERYHARRITQLEALDLLREAHERGDITTAWFKVATGGRTGVICACCTCCCGALKGMRMAGQVKGGAGLSNIIPSGYVAEVDPESCDSCGTCAECCFFGAAAMEGERLVAQHPELCMGCGLCVEKCPAGARKLRLDPSRGMPLDVDMLLGDR